MLWAPRPFPHPDLSQRKRENWSALPPRLYGNHLQGPPISGSLCARSTAGATGTHRIQRYLGELAYHFDRRLSHAQIENGPLKL
jgi:hypothetical protein